MPEPSRPDRPELDSTQCILRDALRARGIEGQTILEIGCGVGRLHRCLLADGAASAVGIELQKRYIERAKQLARSEGLEDRVTYYQDDFLALVDRLETADLVILDKVVHCTHDPESLIRESTAHTRFVYAIAFPARRPLLALSMWLLGPLLRLILPFRVRFSSPEKIRHWVRENGFELVFHHASEMWHTEIYVRRMKDPADSADPPCKEAP
jgi:SAM-dependent methyltransferase